MIIHEMEQGSPEWFAVKLGKYSATDFQTLANGRKDTIAKLIEKKAAEILTGRRMETFKNSHMERGLELEAEARVEYEFFSGNEVKEVGFVEMNEFIGCSPDGLIGDNGGVEFKSKDDNTHLHCLLFGDTSYKWQLYGNMWVTGRSWWDFVSYNPHFPVDKQLYINRWERDEEMIKKISDGCEYAVAELKRILEDLK